MKFNHPEPNDPATTIIEVEGLSREIVIVHLTDSHMAVADERDPAGVGVAVETSRRFAERNPAGVAPQELFAAALARAAELKADCTVLTGDIIHFPARAGLDIIRRGVEGLGTPYLYTLGNHDWHFPHLPWGDATRDRFYPRFYSLTGGNPAVQAVEIAGVRLLAIDNSNYQLSEYQLGFLRRQLGGGKPCLLFCHIPFALPSLEPAVLEVWKAPIMMGAQAWPEEKMKDWKVRTNDQSTLDAVALLGGGEAAGLAGIFCGHVHFSHADSYATGGYQYVTTPGFEGGYRVIRLVPGS